VKTIGFFNRMLLIVILIGLTTSVAVSDIQPMEVLRGKISQGLAILNDRQYSTTGYRALREERLRLLTLELFDFSTMSRMVLSSHWQDFTLEERMAFVQAFTEFLQRSYLPVLLDRYNGEQIEYVRQVLVSSSRARVEVQVLWREKTVPIDVKMIRREGVWKVYDVYALGISAIRNYRAQFQWLLRQDTPAQVIERLKRMQGQEAR
jgi:phospholipid transport system substrate-binding protein